MGDDRHPTARTALERPLVRTQTQSPEYAGTMPGRVDNSGDVVAIGLQIRQYELIRVLGRGGMDVAYAARDTKLGRRVAMKFLGHTAPELARPTR